jgi:ribonuclease J
MELIIHQGASTLGGNCVEIKIDSESILLDAGVPVKEDPIVNQEYFGKIAQRVKAVFISHPHPDHYEMISYLDDSIQVYMSNGCKKIITVAHKFGQTEYNPNEALVLSENPIKVFNGLTVKPIKVDHSGFESLAFFISDQKTNILYSGDIRDHGRQAYQTEKLKQDFAGIVDYLILEGSLLSRSYEGVKDEEEVKKQLTDVINETGQLAMIAFSSQNIDRLVSVYKACLSAGKTLVFDPYTAYILDQLKDISKKIPQFNWNNIGVLFASNSFTKRIDEEDLYRYSRSKVTKEMIRNHPDRYVIKANNYVENFIKGEELIDSVTLIHSLWSGYADGIWATDDVRFIHCSGHAQTETLMDLVDTIKPSKVIPIHTEQASKFKSIWNDKVKLLEDGAIYTLSPE